VNIGRTKLTQGNINNGHFYLRSFISLFPANAIGGTNKTELGCPILVQLGNAEPIQTDIPSDKLMFRARGPVRKFFAESNAVPGDEVLVERIAEREFKVSLVRQAGVH
jgi:DNA polymerase-3 subunit epsilon